MSSKESWEDMFERLDRGQGEGISQELKTDHVLISQGIEYLAEDSFRRRLEGVHTTMMDKASPSRKIYWAVGVAATLAAVFFLWSSSGNEQGDFQLKMNEAPTYADSASYDSLKKVDSIVDEKEKSESIEN